MYAAVLIGWDPAFGLIYKGAIGQPRVTTSLCDPLLELLMEWHNLFLKQFVEIPRRSIIVCFLSLSANAGRNLPTFEISCSWPPSPTAVTQRRAPPTLRVPGRESNWGPTSVFSLNVPYQYNVQYIINTIFITAVQYEVYIELKWEKFPIKEGLPNHKAV